MADFNAFVSREYPVLHSVGIRGTRAPAIPEGHVPLSLGLLVGGIPSFLATVPVEEAVVGDVTDSLAGGDVRVAVLGMAVDERALPHGGDEPAPEPWRPETDEARSLPAAFLSLVCADGRRIGVARIVARDGSATPEEVARFVLKQIARGVQIPDLASTP
jgi:hypothetical protein